MTLLHFAADLARVQAGHAPRLTDPTDDLIQRVTLAVLEVNAAREAANCQARLRQLRERVQACLALLDDAERALIDALDQAPAQCYVSAADYQQHFTKEGA